MLCLSECCDGFPSVSCEAFNPQDDSVILEGSCTLVVRVGVEPTYFRYYAFCLLVSGSLGSLISVMWLHYSTHEIRITQTANARISKTHDDLIYAIRELVSMAERVEPECFKKINPDYHDMLQGAKWGLLFPSDKDKVSDSMEKIEKLGKVIRSARTNFSVPRPPASSAPPHRECKCEKTERLANFEADVRKIAQRCIDVVPETQPYTKDVLQSLVNMIEEMVRKYRSFDELMGTDCCGMLVVLEATIRSALHFGEDKNFSPDIHCFSQAILKKK